MVELFIWIEFGRSVLRMDMFFLSKLLILALVVSFSSPALAGEPIPMAITIDDIPAAGDSHPQTSWKESAKVAIETLKKHKAGGVYGFTNGILAENMQERIDIMKMWRDAGFLFGNHTYSHKDLTAVTPEAFIADIEKNESVLIDYAASIEELKWLRYPFLHEGNTTEKRYAIRSYLNRRGYKIAPVTVDFEDWAWGSPYVRCSKKGDQARIKELEDSFLKHAQARLRYSIDLAGYIYGSQRVIKHVLLLHLSHFTSRMLDRLLLLYEKEMGVKWIGFKEAMTEPIYKEDTAFVHTDGQTFLQQGLASRKLKFKGEIHTPRAWLDGFCR